LNGVITRLGNAGCDIEKGLETCYYAEEVYLSSLESFANDDTPQKIESALESNDLKRCKMYARSFSRVLYNLGMRELYYINDGIFDSAERKSRAELGKLLKRMIQRKNELSEIIRSR